jgi:hypothetical protein
LHCHCRRLVNALPDKGERLRNAIKEIEALLIQPSSPMDYETITNQFNQLSMSSSDNDRVSVDVYLEKPSSVPHRAPLTENFSNERFNQMKERLKARQAQRNSQNNITVAKLIPLDEAARLYIEEKKLAEVRGLTR